MTIRMTIAQIRALPVMSPLEGRDLPEGSIHMIPSTAEMFERYVRNQKPPFEFWYSCVYKPGKVMGKIGQCIPRDDRVLI